MSKIAVIGDRSSIYGFAALGMAIFPCEDGENAKHTLRKLAAGGYAIIFITEKLAAMIPDEIEKRRSEPTPAVILIPGASGNTGEGLRNVGKSVEKAVGSNILNN